MSSPLAAGSRRALLLGLLAVTVAACGSSTGDRRGGAVPPQAAGRPAARSAPVPTTRPCQPAPIEARAATALVLGINQATTADGPVAADVAALGPGGVIVLGPNVASAAQVRALTDGLRQRSPRRLLVTVDEEGGRVSRLRPILGATPSARTLGPRPLPEITAVATERGTRLRELGFDMVLAPVVDADGGAARGAIGDRAFAATSAEAGARASAFVEGLRRAGLAATAKHFPGQGGLADSHDGTVVFDAPRQQVEAAAAAGFQPALRAGAPAVMMSHVTFPALGPLPASLEAGAYRLLRSMGFDGVAVTDAMGMSAIVNQRSIPEAAVVALAAGADLVLANQGDQGASMRDAIVAAVADGRLPEARLDQAVRRVLKLRGEDPATMVCG